MTEAKKIKTLEYTDEANDELAGITRKTKKVGKDFKYVHKNPLWRMSEFFLYRIVMMPVAYLWCKIKFSHRIVNKKAFRECRGKGYFLYGNHTLFAGDAFIPNILNPRRRNYVIVHPDNISMPFLKNFVLLNGAIPTPTDVHASRNFLFAIEKRIVEHSSITIYPEAHVWPYYTRIRPMHIAAFEYPVKFRDPVYCFTNTFSKRKFLKTPKVTTYIDGPFYPDTALSAREQKKKLSEQVYAAMCERAKHSTYAAIEYKKTTKR